MQRKEYSGCYFYGYKRKSTHSLLTRQLWWDRDRQSRVQRLSWHSTERPLGCCLAPGSLSGCWQTAGDWSWHCSLSWSNIQVANVAQILLPFTVTQWNRSVGPGGEAIPSCWTAGQCLAPSSPVETIWKLTEPAPSWGDTEPLVESPCFPCYTIGVTCIIGDGLERWFMYKCSGE